MKSFVDRLWTRISLEKPIFTDIEIFQFSEDFSEMMDDFWFEYHSFSFSAMRKIVEENQELFEKLSDILEYEPKFFSPNFIQGWLLDVFETGKMPCAGKFIKHLDWSAEKVAPLIALYVKDEQARLWIASHWNVCHKYRYNILWALHDEHVFDYNLFKVYNPHFLRQLAIAVIVFGGVGWLYLNDYIPQAVFFLISALLGYWILTELFFTFLCGKIKAFW